MSPLRRRRMGRSGAVALLGSASLLAAVAVAFGLKGSPCGLAPSPVPATIGNRIPTLKRKVAEQDVDSARALAEYEPASTARIDDLGSPAVDLLRRVPGVVDVKIGVVAARPTRRIIHLRDWHYAPRGSTPQT